MPKISISSASCNHCGICVQTCPLSLYLQPDQRQIPTVFGEELCYDCGHCVAVCPQQAITHRGVPAEWIVPKIAANNPSYDQMI